MSLCHLDNSALTILVPLSVHLAQLSPSGSSVCLICLFHCHLPIFCCHLYIILFLPLHHPPINPTFGSFVASDFSSTPNCSSPLVVPPHENTRYYTCHPCLDPPLNSSPSLLGSPPELSSAIRPMDRYGFTIGALADYILS